MLYAFTVLKSTIVWDIPPCCPWSVKRLFGGTCRLHLKGRERHCFHAGFFLILFFWTLKMEALCSFETSVDTQRTTLRYIPEDGTIHNHRFENLKFYSLVYFLSERLPGVTEGNHETYHQPV
jgi:hypothetical protein